MPGCGHSRPAAPPRCELSCWRKELGVTGGGFYWYFEGRDEFLREMLDTWERRSTDEALERVQIEGGDAREKVWRAGMFTFSKNSCRSTSSQSAIGPVVTNRSPSACAASTTGASITCAR